MDRKSRLKIIIMHRRIMIQTLPIYLHHVRPAHLEWTTTTAIDDFYSVLLVLPDSVMFWKAWLSRRHARRAAVASRYGGIWQSRVVSNLAAVPSPFYVASDPISFFFFNIIQLTVFKNLWSWSIKCAFLSSSMHTEATWWYLKSKYLDIFWWSDVRSTK